MKTTPNVTGKAIVTFGRSYQSLAAVQSLGRKGIECIVCDEAPMMAAQFSQYATDHFCHPSPKIDEAEYIKCLLENIERFRPAKDLPYVLIPIHEDTRVIAKHKESFPDYIKVAVPSFETISKVDPKQNLLETAKVLEITIPKTFLVYDEKTLNQHLKEVQYPAFIKLPDTSGGIGLAKVDSESELVSTFRETQEQFSLSKERPALLQEGVPGKDYCVTALCENGEIRADLTYLNIENYPWSGGSGAMRETVAPGKLIELTQKLLKGLNWHGVAQVDFRWTGAENDQAYLIEVNARFWGGLFHCITSGIDYPWLLFKVITGQTITEKPVAEIGTRSQVPVMALLSFLKEVDEKIFEEAAEEKEIGLQKLKEGNLKEGFNHLFESVSKGLNLSERFEKLSVFLEENKDTATEILSSEDPQAVLGIIYGLSHLMKNGDLPEQFKRS